jgi:hypothetical protein
MIGIYLSILTPRMHIARACVRCETAIVLSRLHWDQCTPIARGVLSIVKEGGLTCSALFDCRAEVRVTKSYS